MILRSQNQILVMLASVLLLPVGCGPGDGDVQNSKERIQDQKNLLELNFAMHNYESTHLSFSSGIFDKEGKPLLSWRVAILPFIDREHLYRRFNLDEPWDSPNNLPLSKNMPKVFLTPGVSKDGDDVTHYRIFVADPTVNPSPAFKSRCLPGSARGPGYAQFPDGTANTLAIVQSEEAVVWTKPDELEYDPKRPIPKLGRFTRGGCFVAMMDGSVRFLPGKLAESTLRNLICANDGNSINLSELDE